MDTKRMVLGMVLVLVLAIGWQYFIAHEYATHPEWKKPGETQQTEQAQTPTTGPTTAPLAAVPATLPATTAPAVLQAATSAPGAFRVVAAPGESKPVTLGSATPKDGNYAIAMSISPKGAGLDSVILNQFTATEGSQQPYTFQEPYSENSDDSHALAARSINVNGQELSLGDVDWALHQSGPDTAIAQADVLDPLGKPLLRITKRFQVPKRSTPSQGYETNVTYSFENLGTEPAKVKLSFNGPTMPPREMDRYHDQAVVAGYNDENEAVYVDHHTADEFKKGKKFEDLFKKRPESALLWAGTSSAYFESLVLPIGGAKIDKISAEAIAEPTDGSDPIVAVRLETPELKIDAKKSADYAMAIFFGPKQRELLKTSYFEAFPRMYDQTLVFTSSYCGICTFQWLIDVLVWMLGIFHFVLRDWGLAIIALVCLVRLILHPITKRSQVSMMSMQKLGPEMERLKKKFGDDKEGLSKAQMGLYKEMGFTPILGCLPMFLQMPIWIALWEALTTEFALRQAPFLWGYTWIRDLAKPDNLIHFSHPIPLIFGWHLSGINILPILMAVVTFINQKYFMPRPVAATPEQEQQQKMMTYMSLLFPLMFYTFPSGLNLYYVTSTGLGLIESKRIRDHIKQKEEAEKAGKVIVDAGRANRRRRDDGTGRAGDPKGAAPKNGVMRWLADLQAKAEQMRRESEPPRGKNKA